ISAAGLLLLVFQGGHAKSIWYYPFIVVLALLTGVSIYRGGKSEKTQVVRTSRAAFDQAALWSATYALIMLMVNILLAPDTFMWELILFLSLGTGVEMYRALRGKKRSILVMIIAVTLMIGTGMIVN